MDGSRDSDRGSEMSAFPSHPNFAPTIKQWGWDFRDPSEVHCFLSERIVRVATHGVAAVFIQMPPSWTLGSILDRPLTVDEVVPIAGGLEQMSNAREPYCGTPAGLAFLATAMLELDINEWPTTSRLALAYGPVLRLGLIDHGYRLRRGNGGPDHGSPDLMWDPESFLLGATYETLRMKLTDAVEPDLQPKSQKELRDARSIPRALE